MPSRKTSVRRDHGNRSTYVELKQYFGDIKAAAMDWMADDASRLSAALAYYAVFSIAPLLVILISIIGLVFGEDAAQGQVSDHVSSLVGDQSGEMIQSAVAATAQSREGGIWAMAVGTFFLLFGASRVFGEMKNSLNVIWGVQAKPGRAIKTMVRERILSFSLILGIGFLLLVSLVVSAALSGASSYLSEMFSLPPILWMAMDFVISVAVVASLFAILFKTLPDVVLRWRDVLPGAMLTALLFVFGKSGLAWYLGTAGLGSSYGAAGSLVVVLMWFYYATTILFFGAELVKVRVRRGSGIQPTVHAMTAE